PVCGTPKWKLENDAQRPAPGTRPARIEKPKIAGQRLGRASLTRGNVADMRPTPARAASADRRYPRDWGCGRLGRGYERQQRLLPQTATDPIRRLADPPIQIGQPYQIVQDANVPLSSAAALNANFPPVFPNA